MATVQVQITFAPTAEFVYIKRTEVLLVGFINNRNICTYTPTCNCCTDPMSVLEAENVYYAKRTEAPLLGLLTIGTSVCTRQYTTCTCQYPTITIYMHY